MPIENSRDMIDKQYGARKQSEDMLQSVPLEQPGAPPQGAPPTQGTTQQAPADGGGEEFLDAQDMQPARQYHDERIPYLEAWQSILPVANDTIRDFVQEFIEELRGEGFADNSRNAEPGIPDNGLSDATTEDERPAEDWVSGADEELQAEQEQVY